MMTDLRISNARGFKQPAMPHPGKWCVRSDSEPYPHLRLHSVLQPDDATRVLRWLQLSNAWCREVRDFSRHSSFALTPAVVTTEAEPAVSASLLRELRDVLQSRLGIILVPHALIEAHRSIEQDHIGPHTDEGVNEVRVALNLNSGWTMGHGGLLSLQDRPVRPRKRVDYCPFHNSATAFRTTTTSYHRVSTVKRGHRYTLLYRFPIAETPRMDPGRASPCDFAHARQSRTVIVTISNSYQWPAE